MELGLSFWITISLMIIMIVGGMILMFIGMKKSSLYEISKNDNLDNFTDNIYKSKHKVPNIDKKISNLIDEEFESTFNLKSLTHDFEDMTKYIFERKIKISKLINDYRNGKINKVDEQNFNKVLLVIEESEKFLHSYEKGKKGMSKKYLNDENTIDYINYKFDNTIDYVYTFIYYFKGEILKQKFIMKKEIEAINNIENSNDTFF